VRRIGLAPDRAHAAKVALAATLLVGIVYAGCAAALEWTISARLVASVDARLHERVDDIQESGLAAPQDDDDVDSSPVYVWRVTAHGPVAEPGQSAPRLPAGLQLGDGHARTITLAGDSLRVYAATVAGRRFIAGQSLADQDHLVAMLRDGEALAAPVLLLAMFCGALTIGVRALAPVEQSRLRQLEFTADASHELRTPLSVISAETSIALSAEREPESYRATLSRIDGESRRLRRIVEDMLWLARFDSAPPAPTDEPLDLVTLVTECAHRFGALAAAQELQLETAARGPAWISAPPEWIDRLVGVLTDNACRFAGSGGRVRISVAGRGARVCLAVEDSGPGVPAEDRGRLFDRFHRSTERGGSAGLGLAIADSIVRSTGGQWRVGTSDLGGALFEVSWKRVGPRQYPSSPVSWARAAGIPKEPGRSPEGAEA
jgi:signal transduction histidine kinase